MRDAGPGLHAAVSTGVLTEAISAEDFTRYIWVPPADARAPQVVPAAAKKKPAGDGEPGDVRQ